MTEAPVKEKMLAREPTATMIDAVVPVAMSMETQGAEADAERARLATVRAEPERRRVAAIFRAMFDAAPDRTPAGEAVAWLSAMDDGTTDATTKPDTAADWRRYGRKVEPLTRPQASLTAMEIARIVEPDAWRWFDRNMYIDRTAHERAASLKIAAEILARLSPSDRSGS